MQASRPPPIPGINIAGATVGQVLVFDGQAFVPTDAAGGVPEGFRSMNTIDFNLIHPDLEYNVGDPWFDQGAFYFDPAAHAVSGAVMTLGFLTTGQCSRGAGLFGDVRLYNADIGSVLATYSYTEPGYSVSQAVVVVPEEPVMLVVQARLRVVGPVLPGDQFNLRGARLRVTNTN